MRRGIKKSLVYSVSASMRSRGTQALSRSDRSRIKKGRRGRNRQIHDTITWDNTRERNTRGRKQYNKLKKKRDRWQHVSSP